MRHRIQKHHPPLPRPSLPRPRSCHVHHLVPAIAARLGHGQGARAGFDRQNASRGARGVFQAVEGHEEDGAEGYPQNVERPEPPGASQHLAIIRGVTREEIETKLVEIVRAEKDIPAEQLKPETLLADAGIDSLDSLTILFAIEEQFHISVPDDRSRALRTLGDMIDVVADLLPKAP
jgi:acyl carrier protein